MGKNYYRAHIDITGRCNLRCAHCYASAKYSCQIDGATWIKTLNRLKDLGIQRIAISGGEPLLHPNLLDVLEHCPDDISILTNSHLITDEFIGKLLEFEKKGKIFTLRISLDGFETYDKVRNISHKKVLENVKKLLDKEFVVVINTTIMPSTSKDEMLRLYETLLDMNVDQWNVDLPFLEGNAQTNDLHTDLDKYSDMVVEIARTLTQDRPEMLFDSVGLFTVSQLGKDFKPHLFKKDEHPCSYQFRTITIDAEGGIKPCPSLLEPVASIFELENIEDFTKTAKWKKFAAIKVSDFDKCSSCKYREICGGGCRANVAHKDIMETDSISCHLMERFEKDIMPLLPQKTAKLYQDSMKRCST